MPVPKPPVARVPAKYRSLVGDCAGQPGTGKGAFDCATLISRCFQHAALMCGASRRTRVQGDILKDRRVRRPALVSTLAHALEECPADPAEEYRKPQQRKRAVEQYIADRILDADSRCVGVRP